MSSRSLWSALSAFGLCCLVVLGACSTPDDPSQSPADAGTGDPGKPDMVTPLGPDEIPLKVAQRCPGGPDCADVGDDVLYAGVAVVNATPQVETFTDTNMNGVWDDGEPYDDVNRNGKFDAYWMAGYDSGRLAYGVNGDGDGVWARALAIKQNQTTVVLVAVDSLGLFADETTEVEKLLDKNLGIDLLMIHATHVHESADLVGGWGPDSFHNGINTYYQDQMRHYIATAVTQAVKALKPARVTMSSILVQDPDKNMKRYVSDARDPVVIENTLHTLQFTDISDDKNPKVITTLVNWAHHPESEGASNHLISSDFVHYLRSELESKGAGPVVYVSGALGGQIGPGRVEPLDDMGNVYSHGKSLAFATADRQVGEQVRPDRDGGSGGRDRAGQSGAPHLPHHHVSRRGSTTTSITWRSMIGVYKRSFCAATTPAAMISDENMPSIDDQGRLI